jgi:8-oxo-dGTP pyrophosphatase MutT (NUDIX family)
MIPGFFPVRHRIACYSSCWVISSNIQARKWRRATIPKKQPKAKPATRVQYGALPYRLDDGGSVEVLLVTSRETKRWIIPKGWPIKGLKPSEAAAREAYEEAGVRGRIAGRAFGYYVYEKRLDDRGTTVPCQVEVFPLLVKRQSKDWPESKQRTVRWFSAAEAAALVDNDHLHELIQEFGTRKASRH